MVLLVVELIFCSKANIRDSEYDFATYCKATVEFRANIQAMLFGEYFELRKDTSLKSIMVFVSHWPTNHLAADVFSAGAVR